MFEKDLEALQAQVNELVNWRQGTDQTILTIATDVPDLINRIRRITELLIDVDKRVTSVINTNVLLMSVFLRHGNFNERGITSDLQEILNTPEVQANKNMHPQISAFLRIFEPAQRLQNVDEAPRPEALN
ncbi:hypothetical protein ACQZV8_07155 [Magnetococcales bacterium HHB-1]